MKSIRFKQAHERSPKDPIGDAGFLRPFADKHCKGGRFQTPEAMLFQPFSIPNAIPVTGFRFTFQ